jgi:hypothetical protein
MWNGISISVHAGTGVAVAKKLPSIAGVITVPVTDDLPTLKKAAKEANVSVKELQSAMGYSELISEEAERREVSPPMIISACLNLTAEVITNCYADSEEKRAEYVTSLFHQLWKAVGLPHDDFTS